MEAFKRPEDTGNMAKGRLEETPDMVQYCGQRVISEVNRDIKKPASAGNDVPPNITLGEN